MFALEMQKADQVFGLRAERRERTVVANFEVFGAIFGERVDEPGLAVMAECGCPAGQCFDSSGLQRAQP